LQKSISIFFTPLRISNAQSNRSMPIITARKAGVFNVQWCKIDFRSQRKNFIIFPFRKTQGG